MIKDFFRQSRAVVATTAFWRSILPLTLVVLVVMTVTTAFLWFQIGVIFRDQYEADLADQMQGYGQHPLFADGLPAQSEELEQYLALVASVNGSFVTIYDADDQRIAQGPSTPAERYDTQGPEMRAAKNGQIGVDSRQTPDGQTAFYAATPIFTGDDVVGVFHVTYLSHALNQHLALAHQILLGTFIVTTLLLLGLVFAITYRMTQGLSRLNHMVNRITSGDLNARVLLLTRGQLGQLAMSLNRMADRLKSQTTKRRKERDRLNTVLRTMNDGIVILNRRGEIRSMNPAAARILQVTIRASNRKSFVQVAKDYRIAAVWNRCYETNSEQSATIDLVHDVSIHIVITPFLKRRARGYLVMIQDLTQLRHLQTVRQDFVSNVSHELRTPLASLRALVETLHDGAIDDPPAAKRFLERMEVEVDALTQMVAELMELSRIESGQVPLEQRPVRVQELLLPAIERLRPQAERNDIELRIEIAAQLPQVMADLDRARQVVTNLVHNAIKFSSKGGYVDIRAAQHGDMVHIIVRDNGIGIASEDLERVFERFYKADRSRSIGGTGLGLSIANHLVQAHGGDIWVESVEGEWSEFGFSLRIAAPTPTSAVNGIAASQTATAESSSAEPSAESASDTIIENGGDQTGRSEDADQTLPSTSTNEPAA